MGKFKKGLFLGGLLGAGMVWMSTTKKGREMREKLLDHAATVYGQVKEKAMASDAWATMTKNKYVAMVQEAVDKYAVQSGLAESMKNLVVKLVSAQWKNLQGEAKKKGK